jgi:tetratricopeptide (TPR) repeat protein
MVRWDYMQGLIAGGLVTFVFCAILFRDGWGLAMSTFVVAAVSIALLPLYADKKRLPPITFFRSNPRASQKPTLNITAFFFVVTYILCLIISLVSIRSGGRLHFGYTMLPLTLAIPSSIIYWNSSIGPWLKKISGAIWCPAIVFCAVVVFHIGAFGSASMQNIQGLSYYRETDCKASLEPYSRAVSIDPANTTYLVNRGWAYYFLKDDTRSIADARKALEINPKDAEALRLVKKLKSNQKRLPLCTID